MAEDTEQLVISISADTSQINRAINRLLGTVNSSTRGIETAFTRTGAAMDGVGASATKLQQQINALTGVNTSMKSRADDIAAYGAQLDAVRAKYNPLFGLSKQYEAELEGINKAAKVGAITSAEQAAAIDALNDRYTKAQSGAKGLAHAHAGLSTQAMALQHSMRGSAEMLAQGIPITQILGMQINHLSYAATGPGGLSGALKEVASVFSGLITPMRLVGVGAVATGALALASLASWKSYTLQLDDTAKTIGATAADLSKLQAAASFRGISADEFTKGISAFGKGVYDAKNNMGALAEMFRANNVHARDFDDALSKAADIIKNASNDQQRLALLQQMGLPATMEWVRLLSGGAAGLKAAKDAALDFGDAANDEMIKRAHDFDEAWNRTTTNFGLGWRSATVTVGRYLKELIDSVPKIGAFNYQPSAQVKNGLLASAFNSNRGSALSQGSDVSRFYSGLGTGAPGNTPAKTSVDPNVLKDQISKGQQYLGLLGQTITATEARRQVELQLQAAALNGVGIDAKRAEVLKKLAEENVLGITSMKQQADSYRVEAAAIGMSVGQAAAYTAAQNALNDARRNGRALTAENIAAINKEAEALGKAAQAAAQLKLASDIKFDRSQIGLSDAEQAANARVRSVFGDNNINSAQAQFYKQQLLINDALKQYSDMGKDAFKGIASDLLAGKSAMESFSNALNKIANKLMDMAIDSLWSKAFGGIGGGGGLGGAGLLSLLPKFAGGTDFAPGGMALVGERGPELVNLPRGSQVIPNHELPGMGGITIHAGSSIVIQGNADSQTLAIMKAELAKRDAQLPGRVVAAVNNARNRRQLA